MKRIVSILFIIAIASASANAQLNVKSSSSNEDIICKDMYCSVRSNNDGEYYLITVDKMQRTNATLTVFLGDDEESALLTLNDMFGWFDGAENKSSLIITDTKSGEELTLYRVSQGTYIITNGDAEYARHSYNQALTTALVGGVKQQNNSASPILGYVTPKVLKKAISILSNL